MAPAEQKEQTVEHQMEKATVKELSDVPTPVKRRGRPRRKVLETEAKKTEPVIENQSALEPEKSDTVLPVPARKRGRPRRQNQAEADMLPLTLGVVLQQARAAKHMKLPSISKKLRIREVYLEALEQGNYKAFPALVYGVGFLKNYATFLGLNPDEMVARFHRETADIPTEDIDIPHSLDPKMLPSFKTWFRAIIALLLVYFCWNVFKAITNKPIPEITVPETETAQQKPEENTEAPITPDELILPAKVEEKTVKKEPPAPPAPKRKAVTYGLQKPATVSLVATEKTWIEIRDTETDSVLVSQTLEPGDRYNPDEDTEGMVLKTTNAGGLDVVIKGKRIKKLGDKGKPKAGIPLDAASLMKD